ncbi:AraC family transcriptional regulator [Mycolicibacterium fluoranthenivorans]|nr:AraC family transcriptional regulator [Mycolicibacterium fluoranthenivorans]
MFLIFDDMELIMASSLTGFRELVGELGGDGDALLRDSGIRPEDSGRTDVFVSLRSAVNAAERAASATGAADFGRQLALRQTMDVLGPVGVAARTAATVAEVFRIFDKFVAAYSPGIAIDVRSGFVDWTLRLDPLPAHPQTVELSLGLILGVLRRFLGADYAPAEIHIPHRRLTSEADYRRYYGCALRDEAAESGFRIDPADLARPVHRDALAHHYLTGYLDESLAGREVSAVRSVADIVGRMLPSGVVTVEFIAQHFGMHPKALQRRLAAEGTTFAAVVDGVRRVTAERYLRDTEMSLLHLSRHLGYAEQGVLTRACRRWFGATPLAYRRTLREEI